MSIDRLISAIAQKQNPTVLGLDPQPEQIPPDILARHIAARGETLEALADAFEETNRVLIDALCELVPAVKLQSACYEQLGPEGMAVMRRTMQYAHTHGLFVMADVKRGDIGSTSRAYSAAWLGRVSVGAQRLPVFDADALTVNPYLGSDNLAPFLQDCEDYDKMVFVLCRTSNRSSMEVQELMTGDRPLYRVIAEQLDRAGRPLIGTEGYSRVGMVIGATQAVQLQLLRRLHPAAFFLVPGYGAQGGRAEDIALAFDTRGRGAIVNSSRGLTCAWQKTGGTLADSARAAALDMRADLLRFMPGQGKLL